MTIAANKTWIEEILTASDLNDEFTHNRDFIKENRDMILGDDAEGTGYSGHDHEGTNGVTLGTDALDDSAVTTAKIADSNVTTAKIADSNVTTAKIADSNVTTAKIADDNVTWGKFPDAVQRYILSQRIKNAELVYEDTDNVTVSFPWTEAAGTAWSNVTGIDVSAETGSGGNVKAAAGANTASTWYYLYIINTFTVAQPVASEFLLTKSGAGETGYTLIGAIYNNASQNIEPFDQFGKYVAWRTPVLDLNGGTEEDWTDIPGVDSGGTMTMPSISDAVNIAISEPAGTSSMYIRPNGSAWAVNPPSADYDRYYEALGFSRVFYTGDQILEYMMSSETAGYVWTLGYYVR